MDFQEVRVYQPGDDIRQIDWHVTAKYGKPFTKLYMEEKERALFFVVDLRSSMKFATHGDFKSVIAARLTAFLAFVADHQKDKIGYIILTDEGLVSSQGADLGLLSQLLNSLVKPSHHTMSEATWESALRVLGLCLPMGSVVFLLSDFHDWQQKDTTLLTPFCEKNTFLFVSIYDALEAELPDDTLLFSNGKEVLVLDAHNKRERRAFHQEWVQRQSELKEKATKYGWGFLPVVTHSDYLSLLSQFCFGESHNGN